MLRWGLGTLIVEFGVGRGRYILEFYRLERVFEVELFESRLGCGGCMVVWRVFGSLFIFN